MYNVQVVPLSLMYILGLLGMLHDVLAQWSTAKHKQRKIISISDDFYQEHKIIFIRQKESND